MDHGAAFLMARTSEEVLSLTPEARIELAFALGEDDLATFMRASGLDHEPALLRLRAARQIGRRPSRSLDRTPATR